MRFGLWIELALVVASAYRRTILRDSLQRAATGRSLTPFDGFFKLGVVNAEMMEPPGRRAQAQLRLGIQDGMTAMRRVRR